MKKIVRTIMIVSVALSMLLFAISCDNETPETPVIPFDPSLPTLPTPDLSMEFYNGSTSTDTSDWSMWDLTIENYSDFPSETTFKVEYTCGTDKGVVAIESANEFVRVDYFKKGAFTCNVVVIAECDGYNASSGSVSASR